MTALQANKSIPPCPLCKGQRSVHPIVYGLVQVSESAPKPDKDQRKVILGGCVGGSEGGYWICNYCGQVF